MEEKIEECPFEKGRFRKVLRDSDNEFCCEISSCFHFTCPSHSAYCHMDIDTAYRFLFSGQRPFTS